jgi:hypothetical protein
MQRGVYRFRAVPDSWLTRARAACLYTGDEGAISHFSAAHLHDIEGFKEPKTIERLVPAHLRVKPSEVLVHSTDEPFQSIKRDGIRMTSLPRTLIDIADRLTMDEVESTLNAIWRKQRNIASWLRQVIARIRRKEWSGVDSELELEVLREIERTGLPKPTKGLVILDDEHRYVIRGDLGWIEWKTVLHCDSVAFHGTEQAMVRDAAQRTELSLLKWTQITVMKRTLKDGLWLRQLDRALQPR